MTSKLSAEQLTVKNADEFRKKLRVLDSAFVGVVLCRTREPYRAQEAMKLYAMARKNMTFNYWTILSGWTQIEPENSNREPQSDNLVDITQALRKIGDSQSRDGIYCMHYTHKVGLDGRILPVLQWVKEYAHTLTVHRKRLILIVPPSFQLPEELQEDVTILDFEPPSYAELSERLTELIKIANDTLSQSKQVSVDDNQREQLLSAAAGMTEAEFSNAFSRALIEHKDKFGTPDLPSAVQLSVMRAKTEVVKRSACLEVMEPIPIEDIGGLETLKSWISKRATCFSDDAKQFGIEPPKGIALIGPPGTGKSASAKAIASVLKIPLIKFDVSRVFASLVGDSEKNVRAALDMVTHMAPCVLMVDEVDKVFQTGAGGDSGVSQRVLGAILTWMQESNDNGVFVVVTANRVNNLPSEFLRRGRMNEIFSVSLPQEEERKAILEIHLAKRGKDPSKVPGLEDAVEKSEGYVPAEIEEAVKDALVEAYTGDIELTGELIGNQLAVMKPLAEAFAEDFEYMRQWAENNARPASAIKPKARTRSRGPSPQDREIDLGG